MDARIANQVENFAEVGVTGTVPTARIADTAITTAKIADDAVTSAKIADDAVTADKLAADAVPASDIKAKLETLTGTNRLEASAIQNIPTGGGGLDQTAVDARVAALVEDWAETAHPTVQAPASKISGIPAAATVDRPRVADLTVNVGRDGTGTNYGYNEGVTFGTPYGTIEGNPFDFGGVEHHMIAAHQNGAGLVTIRFRNQVTASVIDASVLELGGVMYPFADMTGHISGLHLSFTAPRTAIFTQTVGTDITVRIWGPYTAFKQLKDQVDALPATATPQPVADTGAVGSPNKLALEDHQHATDRLTEAEVDERISALASNRDVIAVSYTHLTLPTICSV